MKIPGNVLRFEALLYVSLMLDALSLAFQDRTPTAELTEQMILPATIVAAALILLQVYFVWLAARQRKNWPRLGTCRSTLVVGDLVVLVDRRERPGTRQQHWDHVLRSDRGRTLFLLHR